MAKSRQNHIQDCLGPNCRFEAGNPQMGQNGSDVWNLFGNTQDGDKCVIGQSEGGITHVYGDRTIEIVGGQKNPEGSVDIFITGLHGSIVINALENGDVCIKGRNIHMEAKEDITIKAGNNIKIQAKNILELGPGKKGYCKFTETTKRPNWHAICGYQENLIGRAGLGLRAESLFNSAAGLAAVAAGGPVAAAVANVGASAVKDLASGKVPGPASLATNLASSALSSVPVPGGDLIGKVAQGQGIVGAATNVLTAGGLAPGAVLSNIGGNVVQDIPGSLVGTAGEVLGNPVGAASDLLGIADPGSNLSQAAQAAFGDAVDQALEDAKNNVPLDPTDVLDF